MNCGLAAGMFVKLTFVNVLKLGIRNRENHIFMLLDGNMRPILKPTFQDGAAGKVVKDRKKGGRKERR